MADFNKYAPLLKKLEGGWSNNPHDMGGATMCGVTLQTFRRFFGQERTKEELRNISDEQWGGIMKTFWDNCKGDMIENQSIAEIFVDWSINSGVSGIRTFQRLFGLKDDGVVGKKTLAVLNGPEPEAIFSRIREGRENFFRKIVARNASQQRFLKGWLNRLNHFEFKGVQ